MKYYNNTNSVIKIKLPRCYKGLCYPKDSVRVVNPNEKIMIADELLDYGEIPELINSKKLSLKKNLKKIVRDVKVVKVAKAYKAKDKKNKKKDKLNKKKNS